VKTIEEVLPKLTPGVKAWVTYGPDHKNWTVERVCQHILKHTGENVDPASVEKHLRREGAPIRYAAGSDVEVHSPAQSMADQDRQSHSKNWKQKLPANSSVLSGDALYLQRARKALPILVRQALAGQTIFYSDLADELGMANPRNLNHVLGAVGKAIQELGFRWKERVPPLQCLVVNKNTGMPGEGIGWFVSDLKDFKHRTREEKKQIVLIELTKVFNYSKWEKVLGAFQLKPLANESTTANLIAKARGGGGVGECEDHRKLKQYVATNPKVIGLSGLGKGETEYCFPSADRIDIVFRNRERWVGVEVKGPSSPDADLVRGLFQTVKYIALREAELKSECRKGQAEVILVLSRRLPAHLKQLKNLLAVNVVDGVVVPEHYESNALDTPLL
jgi:hypothetical protein